MEMMPAVQTPELYRLSASERRRLTKALNITIKWSYAPRFTVAVLRVLAMLGDYEAVPLMERLARSGMTPSIQKAAKAYLPALKARTAASADTLLRVSSAADLSGTLLRAASGSEQVEPGELLRASAAER